MRMRLSPTIALAALLSVACSQIGFDEEETTPAGADESAVDSKEIAIGSGRGTLAYPLTVAQMIEGLEPEDARKCYVVGYIVGSTKQNFKNAVFGMNGAYEHNVLLADDKDCKNADLCIAVELKTKEMRENFSLTYLDTYGIRFIFLGTYGNYFSRPGLRSAEWEYEFNEPETNEWDTKDITY